VTVIDAKNVSGNVRAVTKGIGKRKRQLLMVNGRDRTKMIAGVVGQVEVVSSLLEDVQPPIVVPVRGIICWWKYEGLPLIGTNRIEIDGVRVLNRNGSAQIAGDAGAMSDAAISVVADFLDAQLRPS
jgi:hypothetical protein